MKNKPLIILASARASGDTLKLIKRIFPDNEVEIVDLLHSPVAHYNYESNYPEDDYFNSIIEKIIIHDLVIWATPVYWYSMSGLLKVFFDRLSDIITVRKDLGRKLAGKKTSLLAVGSSQDLPPGFDQPFRLTASYFDMDFIDTFYTPRKNIDLLKEEDISTIKALFSDH